MESEKSQWYKDRRAYTFEKWERHLIADLLKTRITKLEKEIEKVRNNSKNEGQANFIEKIREHKSEIDCIQDIITEFSK